MRFVKTLISSVLEIAQLNLNKLSLICNVVQKFSKEQLTKYQHHS